MKLLFNLFGFGLFRVDSPEKTFYDKLYLGAPEAWRSITEITDENSCDENIIYDGQRGFDIFLNRIMNDFENTVNLPRAVLYDGRLSADAKLLYMHIIDSINQNEPTTLESISNNCFATYEYVNGTEGIQEYFLEVYNELKDAELIAEVGLTDKEIVLTRPPVFVNNP